MNIRTIKVLICLFFVAFLLFSQDIFTFMFSFFTKKEFLVDYLEGFVDIHNHILPGIDDGAKTVDESISLIQEFADFGVTKFIATPHIMHNYYPNNPDTINASLVLLKNELIRRGMKKVSLQASAEHMIDDNFETLLEQKEVMPLGGNCLLVEMSFLQPSINFDDAIIKIAQNGFFPILAHPERYLYVKSKRHLENKKLGILYQMNMLSLGKYYGKQIQKMTFDLLDNNMYDYIASDVHRISHLSHLKDITLPKKYLSKIEDLIYNTKDTF